MPSPKPYEKTSIWIHLRVTPENPRDPKFQQFISSLFSNFIACYEVGHKGDKRPHFHCLFEKKGVLSKHLRTMFSERFDIHGSDLAVMDVAPTSEDYNAVLEYICKGEGLENPPDIMWASPHYTLQVISDAHRKHHLKKIKTYFPTVVPDTPQGLQTIIKLKQSKTKTWTEKVQEYIDETYPYFDWDYQNEKHIILMTEIVMLKMGQKAKDLDEVILDRKVMGFLNSVDAKGLRSSLTDNVLTRIQLRGGGQKR